MTAVQRRAEATTLAERNGRGIADRLPDAARGFLAEQPLVMIGFADEEGALWCSLLTGPIGFVSTLDERNVLVEGARPPTDPVAGLAVGRPVGMLAIEPATRRRMRVNGTVAEARPDALRIEVGEAFSNCPKYIHRRSVDAVVAARRAQGVATVRTDLDPDQLALIADVDTVFVATTASRDAGAGVDCSHRGGEPGFVRVHDRRHLSWCDLPGNSMFLTLGNLEVDERAGLLVVDWDSGATVQISGRARTEWHGPRDREVHLYVDAVRETRFPQ